MKKLKLDLHQIEVLSFAVDTKSRDRGTVNGFNGYTALWGACGGSGDSCDSCIVHRCPDLATSPEMIC